MFETLWLASQLILWGVSQRFELALVPCSVRRSTMRLPSSYG